jgi:hypothetical protein
MKRTFSRQVGRLASTAPPHSGRTIRDNGSVVFDSVGNAISSLGRASNSEWENVAAAAAVVAAGTSVGSTTFSVDEKVLVFLNILNHTNTVDPKEAFTVNPVNRLGYPAGEGKTQEEQSGPWVYVLATIRRVHFDEDDRYYTVARMDTGTEQRADAGKCHCVMYSAAAVGLT